MILHHFASFTFVFVTTFHSEILRFVVTCVTVADTEISGGG